MPLIHFAPLVGDASVDWYVIQPNLSEGDLKLLTTVPHVLNPGHLLLDFADNGGAGRPARRRGDGRHVRRTRRRGARQADLADVAVVGRMALVPDRTDSPWYPTVRLFRQPKIDDWSTVIDEVQQGLIAFETARVAALAA